jgi:hypothetical protein
MFTKQLIIIIIIIIIVVVVPNEFTFASDSLLQSQQSPKFY